MSREDRDYIFSCIENMKKEIQENNIMLKQILMILASNSNAKINDIPYDFGMNILANLISNRVSY